VIYTWRPEPRGRVVVLDAPSEAALFDRAADLIVVLDEGRVVETGSHDALRSADGAYAELFRLQPGHTADIAVSN
jgi:hypothetical protein